MRCAQDFFRADYVLASLCLTGERRRYSVRSGSFAGTTPYDGTAWELAVRRSYLDLNSATGTVTGGREFNLAWGLNWYPNQNMRLMFNYVQVDTDEEAGNDDPVIFQMRVQWVI